MRWAEMTQMSAAPGTSEAGRIDQKWLSARSHKLCAYVYLCAYVCGVALI